MGVMKVEVRAWGKGEGDEGVVDESGINSI